MQIDTAIMAVSTRALYLLFKRDRRRDLIKTYYYPEIRRSCAEHEHILKDHTTDGIIIH